MAYMGVTVRCANCTQEIEIFGISNVSLDIQVFPTLCRCLRTATINAIIEEIETMEGEEE